MNFSPIISWARSTSYDVVGILIPGLMAILLSTVFIFYLPCLSGALEEIFNTWSFEQKKVDSPGHILIFILLAYLIGFSIKAIGDSVTSNKFFTNYYYRKYFFWGPKLIRYDYSKSSVTMLPVAAKSINKYLTNSDDELELIPTRDSTWPNFYKFSQSILEINQYPTKVVTYQNRYELFKSLSVVFGFFSIVAIGNCLLTLVYFFFSFSMAVVNVFIVSVLIFFLLCFFFLQCRDLYFKFWRNLGDTLITSTIVVLERMENKNPPSTDVP